MAKYWQPGSVKTRLGRSVGMQAAAEIHRELFRYVTETLSRTESPSALADAREARSGQQFRGDRPRLEVVLTPAEQLLAFQRELDAHPAEWHLVHQCSGDLGKRMRHWFSSTLAGAGRPRAVLVGCDCPLVTAMLVAQSFERLQHHDVVLGPAHDGGYYLVGLAGPYRPPFDELFRDIPWSTADVLPMTLQRAEAAGLTLGTLERLGDVDDLSDLQMLCQQLAAPTATEPQRRLGERLAGLLSGQRAHDGDARAAAELSIDFGKAEHP